MNRGLRTRARGPGLRIWFLAAIILYAALSLWSLGWFPFVHSDEAWLGSLTRAMLQERSLAATEDFFVLTPRYPHAIKVLYHILQMPFVALSFSPLSLRLLGWLAGIGSLSLICLTGRILFLPSTDSRVSSTQMGRGLAALIRARELAPAAVAAVLFATDVQLLTAFHTARQESLLLFVLVLALWFFFCRAEAWRTRDTVVLAAMLGGSIGLHPNSFVIALPFALLLFTVRPAPAPVGGRYSVMDRVAQPILFAGLLGGFAAIFVGISFLMDPEFISHYAAFGESVGVGDSFLRRWFRLRGFIQKLYQQAAGTYYLPPIRFQLWLSVFSVAAGLGISVGSAISGRKEGGARTVERLLICVAAIALGIFAVGKYSPPSVVFILPPVYLLVGSELAWLWARLGEAVAMARGVNARGLRARWGVWLRRLAHGVAVAGCVAAIVTTVAATAGELGKWRPVSYRSYQSAIAQHTTAEDIVLGNLNTAFGFEYGQLRTWRDLAELQANGLTFGEFVDREGVSVILYPDELDLIYRERPVWNEVYGNLHPYYEELQLFLARECELVATLSEPVYAMRLVSRVDDSEAALRIYRVGNPPARISHRAADD